MEFKLQDLFTNGNISADDAALIMNMKAKYLDNFISERHSYKICQRADGRWQTKIKEPDGAKSIGAASRPLLLEKLYKHYSNEDMSLERLYPEWYADVTKRICSQTTDKYRQAWKKYLKGNKITKIPLNKLRPSDWLLFAQEIVGNQALKRRAYTNIKTVVLAILDYAVLHDYMSYNILRSVTREQFNFKPSTKDRDNDYFTMEEYEKLFDYLEQLIINPRRDSKYAAMLVLQLSTGMRVGEVKALHWSDYNDQDRTFWVHREVVYRRDTPDSPKRMVEVAYTKAKNPKANRTIPVPDKAMMAVDYLRSIASTDYVVANENNGFIDTDKYNKWIHRYCEEAGITSHSSHDTRRYAISKMLNEGLDASTVQRIAGHLNFSTTEGYIRDIQFKGKMEDIRRALG